LAKIKDLSKITKLYQKPIPDVKPDTLRTAYRWLILQEAEMEEKMS
jgi:hypothetical protein